MSYDDVLGSRMTMLRRIVREGFDDTPAQVQGFVTRVLQRENRNLDDAPLYHERPLEENLNAVRFDGYPALARAGYVLAGNQDAAVDVNLVNGFVQCIEQQRGRPPPRQIEIAHDALALLGIADGLRAAGRRGDIDGRRLEAARNWARELLDQHGGADLRLIRARRLASDLLDDQGRFGQRLVSTNETHEAALDLCLWRGWSDVLRNVKHPDAEWRHDLFRRLLTAPAPAEREVLQAASWLCALDVLTNEIARIAVPDGDHVARILAETQGSFRRWRWDERPKRRKVIPSRWIIDNEADVQGFLLAVLYPYFVEDLEDEQYLQGFGLRQGRFDFAITSVGLIVEVKVIRTTADIDSIEAEIADDLALYFKPGNPFRTMIVYIYDDRDVPEPERYPAIRDALRRRSDRIVDVVVVQRPSMIPNRSDRA
ncbi:MAG: hypothetical protein OXF79_20380 [Chloroflexi bacterium]|nr:hypothetical protein [Chloroflexota bacterium]